MCVVFFQLSLHSQTVKGDLGITVNSVLQVISIQLSHLGSDINLTRVRMENPRAFRLVSILDGFESILV